MSGMNPKTSLGTWRFEAFAPTTSLPAIKSSLHFFRGLLPVAAKLQRAQEIQDVLLLRLRHLVEAHDYSIRFRMESFAITGMFLNGREQIRRSAVVQKKNPLSDAPQRRRAELVWAGMTLHDAVGQS
jgi:hypothetical protein